MKKLALSSHHRFEKVKMAYSHSLQETSQRGIYLDLDVAHVEMHVYIVIL